MSVRAERLARRQSARGSPVRRPPCRRPRRTGLGLPAAARQQAGARGLTLIEVLVGSLIGAVLVAGLMAAFLTALRITSVGQGNTEAAAFAQQTLERFRNKVACGEGNAGEWFNPTCGATGLPPANSSDPLNPGAMYNSGTRKYTVTPADCDGIGGPGDCFKVVAKVSWTQPS